MTGNPLDSDEYVLDTLQEMLNRRVDDAAKLTEVFDLLDRVRAHRSVNHPVSVHPIPDGQGSTLVHDEDGNMFWLDEEGYRHRTDGPAAVLADGTRYHYIHGKLHRDDGPAIEYPFGKRIWAWHGLYHRTDGPAIEQDNHHVEWFWMGVPVSKTEHDRLAAEHATEQNKLQQGDEH